MKNRLYKIYKKIQSKIYIKRLLAILSVPLFFILFWGLLSHFDYEAYRIEKFKQTQIESEIGPKRAELDLIIEKFDSINNEYDKLKKELEGRPSPTHTPEYTFDYISTQPESFGITGFKILRNKAEIMSHDFKKLIAPSPHEITVINNLYIITFRVPGTDCSPIETEQQHLDCMKWFKSMDKECMEYCGIWIYNDENKKLDHVAKLPKIEKGINYVDLGGYLDFKIQDQAYNDNQYLIYSIEKTKDNGYKFSEYYILNLSNYKSMKVNI